MFIEDLYKFENQKEIQNTNYRSFEPEADYAVKFDEVSFTYLRSNEKIFNKASFEISKGTHHNNRTKRIWEKHTSRINKWIIHSN